MNFEKALGGSILTYVVFITFTGTAPTIGLRVLSIVGWTVGWLLFSLVWQAIKERS